MLYIEGNSIRLTRGDTAYLTVPIFIKVNGENTEEYTMQPDDTLTLSVKKAVRDVEYCFQKVTTGTNTIHILPQDTAELAFGKYKYDVQLVTAGGDVFTLIEVDNFELLQEVTC